MSKCVYSPFAAFGKQNVSGKQKRAFLLSFVQRGCWLNANREHGHTNAPQENRQLPLCESLWGRTAPLLTPVSPQARGS